MAVNKVNYGDSTLIDLTGDTVTEETLAEGVKAHDASGTQITGKMKAGDSGITVETIPVKDSTNAISSGWAYNFKVINDAVLEEMVNQITQLNEKITKLEERLGGLTFKKSTTEPNVSTGENIITFVK